MEVEEEHEVLRAVRRNAERLSSSSSNNNDIDDDNKDNAEAISSCLRSLRAHFCRGGQKGKKKRDEVSAKDCLRVRGGFVFRNCFFMNARALSSILFLSLRRTGTVSLSRDVRQSQSQTRAEKTHATCFDSFILNRSAGVFATGAKFPVVVGDLGCAPLEQRAESRRAVTAVHRDAFASERRRRIRRRRI